MELDIGFEIIFRLLNNEPEYSESYETDESRDFHNSCN